MQLQLIEKTKNEREIFHGFDTVRSFLAITVALGHFFIWNGVLDIIPSSFFMAVDFFFVLSGFVLAQSVLLDKSINLDVFLYRFVIRRFFRLFPLYLLLLLICIITLIKTFGASFDSFYYSFISSFMLQGVGFSGNPNHIFADTVIGIGWSTSVEFWVGIPFFCFVFSMRTRPVILFFISLTLGLLAMLIMVNYSPNFMNVNLQKFVGSVTFGSVRGLFGFCVGCCAYICYKNRMEIQHVFSATLLEIFVLFTPILLYFSFNYDRQNEFIAPVLFGLILYTFASSKGLLNTFLSSNALSFIRPLSYSIYLTHPFLVLFFRKFYPHFNIVTGVTYAISLLCISFFMYHLIEKRGIEYGYLFLSKNWRNKAI